MLVQKGQYIKVYLFTSSFIYPCQDQIIYIKICIPVKQDFNKRIKIYVHVSRSACEYIKSNKYWSTSSCTDGQSNTISKFAHRHRDPHTPRASRSNPRGRQFDSAKVPFLSFILFFFFLLNYINGKCSNCCLHHVCNEECWRSQYNVEYINTSVTSGFNDHFP